MTRLGIVLTASLGLASTFAPATLTAQDAVGVTGAAEASLPDGATFGGLSLKGLTLGQGIFIDPDGSAKGQFQAVLQGTTALGSPQDVVVEGEVSDGSAAGGTATFSGTATVSMGDGTPSLTGVPFTVTASAGSLGLILNGAQLPTATVNAGSIAMQ
jgi:hypothetical protein